MNSFFSKTFGGLLPSYYLRHWLFGLIFTLPLLYLAIGDQSAPFFIIPLCLVNTFLYPYSRFVYEQLIGYICGDNIFIVNAIFGLLLKLITMWLCWSLAIFIAPIGLGYLYFYHSRYSVGVE